MRFMVMIKANPQTEAGEMPSAEVLAAMGRYNEELANAGVLLGGEGLQSSSKGVRVSFAEGQCSVVDGPFAETRELVAGYWLFKTESLQQAIEWGKRCPQSAIGEAEIEIRQLFEAEDFGAEFTPELREQEERLRAQLPNRQGQ
nr:YciI family protein [Pseudomonas sp.]